MYSTMYTNSMPITKPGEVCYSQVCVPCLILDTHSAHSTLSVAVMYSITNPCFLLMYTTWVCRCVHMCAVFVHVRLGWQLYFQKIGTFHVGMHCMNIKWLHYAEINCMHPCMSHTGWYMLEEHTTTLQIWGCTLLVSSQL